MKIYENLWKSLNCIKIYLNSLNNPLQLKNIYSINSLKFDLRSTKFNRMVRQRHEAFKYVKLSPKKVHVLSTW